MIKLLFRLVILLVVAAAIVLLVGGASADESQQTVLDQLVVLQQRLETDDASAAEVSGWSIHEHAEHVVLAAEGMYAHIEKGEVPDDATSKTLMGRLVLQAGFIPRGKGEAPEATVPGKLTLAELRSRLEILTSRVRDLDAGALEKDERILGNHVYFGGFSGSDWMRMMSVHGEHHAKITGEIATAAAGAS